MNRQQLAHILRAASTITEDADVLLIGSQAILASHDDSELPDDAIASIEADVAFLDDPDNSKADLVDGNIGEGSHFQETHGYYGQGVSLETPTLPAGWRERIVMFDMQEALPSRARCLDKYDLVVSKLVAQREKDMTFAAALMHAGLISHEVLKERAGMLDDPVTRMRVVGVVEALRVAYAKEAPDL